MILSYQCPNCDNRKRVIVSTFKPPRVVCSCGQGMGALLFAAPPDENVPYERGSLSRGPASGWGQ